MLEKTVPRLQRFVAARLSPEGEFGLHLTIGIAAMLLATWLFGQVADEVLEGEEVVLFDERLAQWFNRNASVGFTRFMLAVTHMHSTVGMIVLGLALGAWLYYRRERWWLMALATALPGVMLLNVTLKHVFQRARPQFEEPLLTLTTYSFPSGHTSASTVFYGLLACYIASRTRSPMTAALAAAGALLAAGLVGLSRMVLGVHYLTDVLAAMAEGWAWLALCITAVSTLRRRTLRLAATPPANR